MSRLIAVGLLAALLVACAAGPRGPNPMGSATGSDRGNTVGVAGSSDAGGAGSGSASVESLAAAIKAAADRSDHETASKARADLAADAGKNADACLALDPHAAACLYGRAVADGMEAHEHPTRAPGLLGHMVQSLDAADTADPNYDKAGPSRVKALVLVRAPGWPIGPGDADGGVVAARRAVSLQPDYPPNMLALAEALAKTGDAVGARESYAHARDLASALPPGAGRDDWLLHANEGLQPK